MALNYSVKLKIAAAIMSKFPRPRWPELARARGIRLEDVEPLAEAAVARGRPRRNPETCAELIARHKARPCLDCGHKFPPVCMDFDHVRGRKVANISSKALKYWALVEEIEKCEVVCSNCHRVRTDNRRKGGSK